MSAENKKYLLILAGLGLVAAFLFWKPSSSGIAEEMTIDEEGQILFDGHRFATTWAEDATEIQGHLRLKERFYNSKMPIIAWTFVVTSGEFSDPDFVSLTTYPDGTIQWKAPRMPSGELTAYHLIAASPEADAAIQAMDQGGQVVLRGKVSSSGRIVSDGQPVAQTSSKMQKFLLVESVSGA